ncbi:MAG: M2 family metallopeptidase [Deltaproteobacteria bacterium]|nr:M2 family metallopeptidase [Deltaproteobacteria bacterium]
MHKPLAIASLVALISCGGDASAPTPGTPTTPDPHAKGPGATPAGPSVADADAFLKSADAELRRLWVDGARADWTYETDITDEHEAVAASKREATMAYLTEAIPQAASFRDVAGLSDDGKRQLHLLRIATTLPAPADAARRKELADIATKLNGMYGKGEYCTGEGDKRKCRDLGELEDVLATDRDPAHQLEAWEGWHSISPPMRPLYTRFVELGNEGAKEIGFADMGELWRSGYDMTPAEFEREVDRLYAQVEPLYKDLHCYTRKQLNEQYGDAVVAKTGPIPAHLTGNMWAQSWENIYPTLEPFPGEPDVDPTKAIVKAKWDPKKMAQTAEGFFTSMGLDPLPATFWERSMFVKPEGKEAVCHASAWDVEMNDDLRIKMCIKPTYDDLVTLHHELGHNYYYHYYYKLPALYQGGANDGFHEAIGDAIALSMTPSYLQKIGLAADVSDSEKSTLNFQMQMALQKVAFLPFGRMIDQWRWDVFSGKIAPADYNAGWWKLRGQFQGIAPATPRDESHFDPGAKYHIPGNTPYIRYFLADILQFQFYDALCDAAGHQGPLHTCSAYGSKEAGSKLQAMLAMGASKPWPDALQSLTGKREMDGAAFLEYFAPLQAFLKEQNADQQCGW